MRRVRPLATIPRASVLAAALATVTSGCTAPTLAPAAEVSAATSSTSSAGSPSARGAADVHFRRAADESALPPLPPPATDAWPRVRSASFTFALSPRLSSRFDAAQLARWCERHLARLERTLGVAAPRPIEVFVYKDATECRALTGHAPAFTEPGENRIHLAPGHDPGHEVAHAVAAAHHVQRAPLLAEGLATWLDGQGRDYHHAARTLLARGNTPPLAALVEPDAFLAHPAGYPLAASFCGYLIETRGMTAFLDLYRSRPPVPDTIAERLDLPWARLVAAWRAFLDDG